MAVALLAVRGMRIAADGIFNAGSWLFESVWRVLAWLLERPVRWLSDALQFLTWLVKAAADGVGRVARTPTVWYVAAVVAGLVLFRLSWLAGAPSGPAPAISLPGGAAAAIDLNVMDTLVRGHVEHGMARTPQPISCSVVRF